MKWFFGGVGAGILALVGICYFFGSDLESGTESIFANSTVTSTVEKATSEKPKEEPLVDYSQLAFDVLAQKSFPSGEIKLGKVLSKEEKYTSYIFTYQSDGKTISGMVNLPKGGGKFPVIILLRGYADKTYYHTGLGTERSANFLAENGFLTLAPDFLGYAYSDLEDEDILKARFYRPVEVLSLLSAVSNLPSADSSRIGLWGHSNGAQVALSVLEITGKNYPTSLWAPVSLDFPECLLTYLGEEEEVGNPVKEKVDLFLRSNDPKQFSISPYFDKIKASFLVHQGTVDELIQMQWTEDLVKNLEKQGNEVNFYKYKGENHNFNWYKTTGDTLRQRDLEFFRKNLLTD